jgi:hypothetical protein
MKQELEIMTICCILDCKRIKLDEFIWKTEDELENEFPEIYKRYTIVRDNRRLSHGYCPECYKKFMDELDNL